MILYTDIDQGICLDENHQWAHNDDYVYHGHWYCLICGMAVDEDIGHLDGKI